MRHKILPMMLLLALCVSASAQTYDEEYEAESFTLDKPLKPDKSYHYTASGIIDLTPGFDYAPKKGKAALFEIDPMMVFPPQGGVTGGTAANNTGGVVGSIGGTVSVSALGGAVYTIPVELPPGKDGMQPSLGIAYNSQSGNGLLGYGWSLNGLSAVTRCGRTIYHDNVKTGDAVDYENDRFLLDGQRLLSISSGKTYGQDGCEYRTEVDNISRVISYGGDGQNPASFKVWTKDGHIIEYGVTPDSKLVHPDGGEAAMWMVSTISDYNGNYISYTYTTTGESCRIDHIDYTGCDGISPMYSVQFEYDEREDREFAYLHNQKIVSDVLLESISVNYKATNEELYRYTFAYDGLNPSEGRFYSRLLSVGLEQDGVKVNPTRIEWYSCHDNSPYDIKLQGDAFNDTYGGDCFVGDFNGDGYDDFVKISTDFPYSSSPHYNGGKRYINVLYNDRNGNFNIDWAQEHYIEFDPEDYKELSIDNPVVAGLYSCELNGDGLCDILLLVGNCSLNITRLCFVSYIAHKTDNGVRFLKHSDFNIRDNFEMVEDYVFPGDFLGNGMTDMIVKSHADGYGDRFTFILGDKGIFNNSNSVSVYSPRHFENHFIGDFNGDGKNDLFCFDTFGYCVYSISISNGNRGLEFKELCSDDSGLLTSQHRVFNGDFNGDGKTDMISWRNSSWKVHFSKSDGWETFDINQPDIPTDDPTNQRESLLNYSNVPYSIRIGDMNGDGKSDVTFVHGKSVQVFFSPIENDGTGQNTYHFKNSLIYNNHYNPSGHQHSLEENRIGNFNGTDYVSLWLRLTPYYDKQTPPRYSMIEFRNQSKQNVVVDLTDGLGNKLSFEYEYLTRDDFCHTTPGFVSEYGMTRKQVVPLKALKSYKTKNVNNHTAYIRYEYSDLILNLKGKGIMGFMTSCVYDDINGMKVICVNEYEDYDMPSYPFLIPKSSTTSIYNNGSYKTVKSVEYSIGITNHPNQFALFLPQTHRIITRNYGLNEDYKYSEIIEYEYDNDNGGGSNNISIFDNYTYNNIVNVKKGYTTVEDCIDAEACPFSEESSITYEPAITDDDRWLVSRVRKNTTTTRIMTEEHGVSGIKGSTEYTYNPSRPHLVETELTNPGDKQGSKYAIKTEYQYSFAGGNVCKVTTKVTAPNDSGVKERTSAVEYSPEYQYRFATTTTNSLGHSATAVYDPKYGRKLSDTDCNGLTEEYTSDFFGTDAESVSPDGLTAHSSKRWCDGCDHAPANASYYTWSQSSGSYPVMTFYHKTGAVLREVSRGIDGETVYVDMEYDAKGNLWKQSLPYEAGGSPAGCTEYAYDALNRVTRTDYPDKTWDEVVYSGGEVSVTHHDASDKMPQTVTRRYHPNGWLESTTDAGGNTVGYVYNSDGTLHSASAGGSDMAVTLTYNEAGMRDGIDDPDYGCMRYDHNAFGEVTVQTTPQGATTKYEYDALGRQTRRTVNQAGSPEEVTAWKYSDREGRIGTLENVTMQGIHKVAYLYDDMLRVVSSEETFDGETYVSSYTYDKLGRLSTETYPSGVTVVNRYNDGGFLYAVKGQDGGVLWKADGHDVQGHLTDFRTGNGLVTHHEYDGPTGRLLGIITRSDKKILQDYAYTYDDFGNFASRKKKTGNMPEESFTYDELNRLTVVETNGKPFNTEYDGYGRITMKEQEVFSFRNVSFDKEHPHAAARVEAYRRPPFGGQEVTYTPFDKVETVTADGNSIRIEYGHDRQRIRMTEKSDKGVRVKTYVGGCEFVTEAGAEKTLTYLCAGGGVFAVAETSGGECRMHYVHTDHLGSWDIITDEKGRLEQELSFDAWGNRRNAATWQGEVTDEPMFDRGFTGHEHLYDFGLINMNGRVYDPLMSSFLSPDNFIQCPDNPQNFNRYAYCLNNPLRYTDPSGEVFTELLIAAAICSAVNVTMNGISNVMNGKAFFDGGGKAAIVGFLAGATGAGVAALGAGGAVVGMAAGGVAGGTNAALNGSNVVLGTLVGAAAGWVGGGVSMYIGGGAGAFVGGCASNAVAQIPAVVSGGDFNFGQMLFAGALSCGMYYGASFVNWKWGGGNKMGDVDVSFRQFNRMQTLFQRSRAWQREMGGYLMKDGSFKTAEPGTSDAINLGPVPDDAIASFHTHWDRPNVSRVCDDNGNYQYDSFTGWKNPVITERYHSPSDMYNSGGIQSIVMNRYDASYYCGGSYCFDASFIGPLSTYSIISPPVLRYNFGFLFSIKY